MLRGVNLSASSKLPHTPFVPSHQVHPEHRMVSFVNRPFPLHEADTHFARLKSWGFLFVRMLVTWEALEHAGPRLYDIEFIEYFVEILKKAATHGIKCFLDPHQDVWSRFTGGSGAPGWTLEMVGFDVDGLAECGAAVVHSQFANSTSKMPHMLWPTNYHKLGSATMFTLFFGGEGFAPRCLVKLPENQLFLMDVGREETPEPHSSLPRSTVEQSHVNIQVFLQRHFLNAFRLLLSCIRDAQLLGVVVVGVDTLNEPSGGYLGHFDLRQKSPKLDLVGSCPSPFESMLLAQGVPCLVDEYRRGVFAAVRMKSRWINRNGRKCWRRCVWEAHGVYKASTNTLLRPHYFSRHQNGRQVEWLQDFWKPFVHSMTQMTRSIHPGAVMFIEPPINTVPPRWDVNAGDPNRVCYAPHWYDGRTLVTKSFGSQNWRFFVAKLRRWSHSIRFRRLRRELNGSGANGGAEDVAQCFQYEIGRVKQSGVDSMGEFLCCWFHPSVSLLPHSFLNIFLIKF